MPRFAANLSTMFSEVPFLERFGRAAAAGFRQVEFQFPYTHTPAEVADALHGAGLECALFNLPAGDWAAGARGIAADPARTEEFRSGVARALAYATALGCPRLNCLAGLGDPQLDPALQRATLVENLRYAAAELAVVGRTLLVEPLNAYDVPGFLLCGSRAGLELIATVGAPNLLLQYDVYHMQRGEGELAATIRANLEQIGHIQIADTPGRHQPGSGEINYRFLLRHLDELGYAGVVGLEYWPAGPSEQSLGWIPEYGFTIG